MLEQIRDGKRSPREVLELAKQKKFRLMGFGHRIYKSYDPRAVILKKAAHELLQKMGKLDPLMDISLELESLALSDPYFVERKLYPNVDFYSGIILRALNIPVQMYPVMFAIGRMPGWIAHWYEEHQQHGSKIHRPRQVFTGQVLRDFEPIDER
jgi:citrate synthase